MKPQTQPKSLSYLNTTGNSLRIVYVTPFWPHGPAIGGRVRSNSILQALRQMGTVEVIVVSDEDTTGSENWQAGREADGSYGIRVHHQPNRGLLSKIRWTLDASAVYPNGCRVDSSDARRVERTLETSDLIWFFKLRSPDMFPHSVWKGSVVDIDDVPSTYERAQLQTELGLWDRFRTHRSVFAWKRREKLLGTRFTVLSVCSQEDKRYLECSGVRSSIHVIPNGFEAPCSEPVRNLSSPPRIGFIGLFDYLPNVDGMRWFLSKCWPRLKREIPDVRLRLVGPGSGQFEPGTAGVDGLGWLQDPEAEIRTWFAMVVPIRIGAGTRVKVAQAFSQKCPVVSTSLGAFGYQPVDGENMYVRDSAEAFCDACVQVIREPKRSSQMADTAWTQFLEKWTWDAISPMVWAAAEDCLRLKI